MKYIKIYINFQAPLKQFFACLSFQKKEMRLRHLHKGQRICKKM